MTTGTAERDSSITDAVLVMKPKPSPYRLKRIGSNRDGAYLVPDDLEGIDACFSPGVANTKDFEDVLTDKHGIKCHLCDHSSDAHLLETPLRQGMQTFKKKWLDVDGSADSISLADWIEELSPWPDRDLLLQMDIEGAEYRNLLGCDDAVLKRFRIIVIEIHDLHVVRHPEQFEKQLGPLLRKLDKQFVCVHAHPNNCCGDFELPGTGLNIPNIHELTFLRRDRFAPARRFAPLIPHPHDVTLNVRENLPLLLSPAWCHTGSRGLVSRLAVAKHWVDYVIFWFYMRLKRAARRHNKGSA
jgi:FkbM family methyltransferase